jgi:hypothetical protein
MWLANYGCACLQGRRPDPESMLQHNSLDDDGYNPSTYGMLKLPESFRY